MEPILRTVTELRKGLSIKDIRILGGEGEEEGLKFRCCKKSGKSGSKFQHGGGGYQKRPKNSDFYG